MSRIPKEKTLDSTPALFTDGYRFIEKRCKELSSDVFETRLLLKKTICMRGEEAARLFYDTDKFQREKAAPKRLQKTLFGEGGVQGLDGDAHRNRKAMFMALMSPKSIERLLQLVEEQLGSAINKWESMEKVQLFSEAEKLLCRAVCKWAAVPLREEKVEKRTRQIASLIESAGDIALNHYRGRKNRKKAENWIAKFVRQVRSSELRPQEGSALFVIAWHRDLEDNLIDEKIAAVEILNVLRPTIAVARYIVFLADALHKNPDYRQTLETDDELTENFVQEVRRFYPFFPFAAARVKKDFEWNGFRFPKGRRVLLDLYGTNHDKDSWKDPDVFRPERFQKWNENAYNFIPQGGGKHHVNHRCPGEWITIGIMKLALKHLTGSISYSVPVQELDIDLTEFPTHPESGFIITDVRRI